MSSSGGGIWPLERTDRARLQPWRSDSVRTRQLPAKVNLVHYLIRSNVRCSNRIRAVLLRYYPVAFGILMLMCGLRLRNLKKT